MKVIALLVHKAEDDILPESLAANARFFDDIYTLNGDPDATPDDHQFTDASLPRPPFPENTVDGYRQALLEQAVKDHGHGHLYVLLHADEMWTIDPRKVAAAHPFADGFVFRMPLCFNPGEWDNERSPIAQMTACLRPGYPEFRVFRERPGVHFIPSQHFIVKPQGLTKIIDIADEVRHYPFRSAESQLQRATATFDPDNYQHCPLTGRQIVDRFLGNSEFYMRLEEA